MLQRKGKNLSLFWRQGCALFLSVSSSSLTPRLRADLFFLHMALLGKGMKMGTSSSSFPEWEVLLCKFSWC